MIVYNFKYFLKEILKRLDDIKNEFFESTCYRLFIIIVYKNIIIVE